MKLRSLLRRVPLLALLGFASIGTAAADGGRHGLVLQGVQLQGFKFNGLQLQGLQLNGPLLQGFKFNGPLLQGLRMNGARLDGIGAREALPLTAAFDASGFERPMYGVGQGMFPRLGSATDAVLGHSPLNGLDARQVRVRPIAD
jgi:hypothetical protein